MMENGWNVDASAIQEYYEVQPANQAEQRWTTGDVLARRMKNRERQRRYRARKRLEVHRVGASTPKEAIEPVSVPEPQETHKVFVDHVLCKRDWKKDARRAHLSKTSGDQNADRSTISLATASMGVLQTGRCEESCDLASSSEAEKMKAVGRNWKAEARGNNINQL